MREGKVSVGFNAAEKPADRFGVFSELQLGEPDQQQPSECKDIARRKAQCFVDMRVSFYSAPRKKLCGTDGYVRNGQIMIQSQRAFALGYTLRHAVRVYLQGAQYEVGPRMVRRAG